MKSLFATNIFLLLGGLSLTSPVFAGNDSGNGGHGVICTQPGGSSQLASVEFFDLWYARQELQLGLLSSNKDAKELGREIVLRLFQADRQYFDALLVSYANVSRAQVKLGTDLKLLPPRAFLGNIVPAAGTNCEILPLGVYADSGVLLTQGAPWDFLQSTLNPAPANVHTAAFYVHESLGDMLRKRELAKLEAGANLSEEVRKRIAKDTVNMTAIAFSKLSDKQLLHRLQRYWKTGEVFVKPKIDRIDTKHRVLTDGNGTGEQAWKAAEALCETWKQTQLQRLEPLAEFTLIDCSSGIYHKSKNFDGSAPKNWGVATATLSIVPKQTVVKFVDDLHSALFPPGLDHDWMTGPVEDYKVRSQQWMEANERRFGNRLFFQNTGESFDVNVLSRVWQWRMWHGVGGTWTSGYVGFSDLPSAGLAQRRYDDTRQLGQIGGSTGEVYLLVDTSEITTQKEQIFGSKYHFYSAVNESTEREAARLALKSYEQVCEKWLDARYKEGAVFATCSTDPLSTRGINGHWDGRFSYRVDESQSLDWFTSQAAAYYYDE